jgi:hypothetical protein
MKCVILKYIKNGNAHYHEEELVRILVEENGVEKEYIGFIEEILYSSFKLMFQDGTTKRFWIENVLKIEDEIDILFKS